VKPLNLLRALLLATALAPALAQAAKQVVIITLRGCEEVCSSFRSNLESQGDVKFVLRDLGGNMSRLPAIVEEVRAMKPDLVATWGTGITLGVVGPIDAVDPSKHITSTPVVYMYVGNPVESKIARDPRNSGRRNVAGANTSVPIDAQVRLMMSYRKVERVGMLYNPNERAAASQAASARKAFEAQGIAVVIDEIGLGKDGKPDVGAIEPGIDRLVAAKVDFLYYVGSAFTLAQIDRISRYSISRGLPMFTPLEPSFRRGDVLLGLISPLAGIGQIAAYQAGQILFLGKSPESLPSPTLSRHSVLVNMSAARELKAFPPMKLLQFAEITK
jgi:putative tryptophan/tyrosine transport system substrate-binding protein